ncbi:TPA: hypothetical protein ACYU77_002979 [Klebsiella variicola subsp. variicola]
MNVTEINNVFYCDCGFSWQRGKSGNHDCAEGLREKVKQLAAENVALKSAIETHKHGFVRCNCCGDELMCHTDDVCRALDEIPATDRIVAGIKADGVEEWVSSRGGRWNGTTEEALKFAKQLREGADK